MRPPPQFFTLKQSHKNLLRFTSLVAYTVRVLFHPLAKVASMNVAAVWLPDQRVRLLRPLFVVRVSAGFPSPAEDWVEGRLDLNRYLVRHPAATFFVRVSGDSMIGAGIDTDDILIVDRAAEADDGDVVIARINDELTVKRLRVRDGEIWLVPDNEDYEPLRITEGMEFEVWGKVCHVIHSL